MASLTLDGSIYYANLIANAIDKAVLFINGEEVEKELYKNETRGNKITVLVKLGSDVVGRVDNLKLLASDGTILHDKADVIEKDNSTGIRLGFEFYVKGEVI